MPTSEFVVCPLQAGIEIGDPNNAGAQAIKDCGDTLSKADGLQQVHFGMQVENADTFQMIVSKLPIPFPPTDSSERRVIQR